MKHKRVSGSSGASWKVGLRPEARECAHQKGIKGARAPQPHIRSSDQLEETRHVTLRIKTPACHSVGSLRARAKNPGHTHTRAQLTDR